jgi:hypothetical protein
VGSIVSAIACVALMGMWMRSYRTDEQLTRHLSNERHLEVASIPGRIFVANEVVIWIASENLRTHSRIPQTTLRLFTAPSLGRPFESNLGFAWQIQPYLILVLPFWFLVTLSGFAAMILRFRWPPQFSTQGLFVAVTFLAVVLGMVAWLDRGWIGK